MNPVYTRWRTQGGPARLQPPSTPKPKYNKHSFCIYRYYIKSFTWFTLQLKSATDQLMTSIRILKNTLVKSKKREDRTILVSHRTCNYIRMYTNAAADRVMLYLRHDFDNMIFKTKHKLYIASGSAPPQWKILGAHLVYAPIYYFLYDLF
jgi:hypothetical protein